MKIEFINSLSLQTISGGNIYNHKIISGLKYKNIEVVYTAEPLKDESFSHTIIDSFVLNQLNLDSLKTNRQLFVLIHQLPNIDKGKQEFYKRNAQFIATGMPTQQKLQQEWRVDPNNIKLIRPALEPHWLPKTKFNKLPRKVLVIANFLPKKGYELLIDILKQTDNSDLDFLIIGNPVLNKEYSAQIIRDLKIVQPAIEIQFNLDRNEIYNRLLNADLFLSLSESETFGMALLEALSVGLPSVAFATGDVDFFMSYPNYLKIENYNAEGFVGVLESWSKFPDKYKKYCGTCVQNTRDWDQVVDEFVKVLTKQKIEF